jgi:hypothetical protein
MRKFVLVFLAVAMSALLCCGLSWAACPEDAGDNGNCDTLYVIPYDNQGVASFPAQVRVLLMVTNDVETPTVDSIYGFVMPLSYANRTNPTKYCSTGAWWNTSSALYVYPDFNRSVFRHLVNASDPSDTIYHNRMAHLADDFGGREWGTRIVDALVDTMRFSLIATDPNDQMWWAGNRVLLATMTFQVEDTMTICIDSCFWPPTGRMLFTRMDSWTYVPRTLLPVCFKVDTAFTGVTEMPGSEDNRPTEFSLSQNYPNPFNPETYIEFGLSKASHVKIDIFNIVGQKVKTLVDEEMQPGKYVADWDGKDEKGTAVSSGIYFYRMEADDFSDMKKMLLVK